MSHEELARRAAACERWRWMPGVLVLSAWPDCRDVDARHGAARIVAVVEDPDGCVEYQWAWRWNIGDGGRMPPDALPDLTDPATIGCLLALVREAWKRPDAHTLRCAGLWVCNAQYPHHGDIEAEALVAALEAAP